MCHVQAFAKWSLIEKPAERRTHRHTQTEWDRLEGGRSKDRQEERDGEMWMPWLQPSASVHHLFGSRLERHAISNTVGDYSVQFSTVPPPHTHTSSPLLHHNHHHFHPPPLLLCPPSFSVLVVYPCQSCQPSSLFYLTSPPLPPDFFIKRQPFTQIQEKRYEGKRGGECTRDTEQKSLEKRG